MNNSIIDNESITVLCVLPEYFGGDMFEQLTCARPGVRFCVLTFASWRFPPSLQYLDKYGPHLMILNLYIFFRSNNLNIYGINQCYSIPFY